MRQVAIDDPLLGPLTDDWLTSEVRVYQRKRGHRFSSDDVATAFVAYQARPAAKRVLDLGCGLGSVLLILGWKLPEAELSGVEAQEMSFELVRRNVARSGFARRIAVVHGDLRDAEPLGELSARGPFDLITGTPPYFPPESALDAEDQQRAYARIEYRGGVEAYIAAAAPLLAPGAALVLCGDARALPRVERAAQEHRLTLLAECGVVARAGSDALFAVWTLGKAEADGPVSVLRSSMTLRGADRAPTEDAARLRRFSGFSG